MITFRYKIKDLEGKIVYGELESNNRKQALNDLKLKSLLILELNEIKKKNVKLEILQKIKFSSTNTELIGLNILKRFYDLHKSGLPVGDAFKILKNRITDSTQKEIAEKIWKDLSEGVTLAQSFSNQKIYFSKSTCQVVQAGEATGNLNPLLNKIISFIEEKRAVRKKIISSMTYPIFVSCIAIAVVVLFLTVLLPQIQNMLQQLGGEMTWSAQLLINGSNILITTGPFLLLSILLFFVFIKNWGRSEKGSKYIHTLILKIPLIGNIIYYSNIFQISNLVATLLKSDINTTETLNLTSKTIENKYLKEKFDIAKTQINEGVSIAQALRSQKLMPDIALDILGVGEDTGEISKSMSEVAENFKEELSRRLNQLTTLVSSLALAFAFTLVALIAIGIVTSVFQVSNSI